MRLLQSLSLSLILSLSPLVLYAASQNNSPAISSAERNAVNRTMDKLSKEIGKKLPVTDIARTPVPGILQVTSDLTILYVTTDGEYVFLGDLMRPSNAKDEWSLTELEQRKLRVQALAGVKESDMIIFPSTAKKPIGTVTVFTDIDCPYCHRLQENIKDYTDAGITVRYLSFPRTGPNTKSFDEAIKVWCAKDKAKAYNDSIEKKEFPKDTCKNSPVTMEYDLGVKMGINGTPTMILDNGTRVGGLVDAKTLVKMFNDANKGS